MKRIGHNGGEPLDEFDDAKPGDWIALTRKVREHPIVGLKHHVKQADPTQGNCTRFEAWFDLLCLAQYKPSKINNKGQVQTLDVGQLMGSRAYLAKRWNWTEKSVRHYFDILEAEGMISRGEKTHTEMGHQRDQPGANKCNILTISNYSRYQQISEAIYTFISSKKGLSEGHLGATQGPPKGHNLTSKQLNTNPLTPLKGGQLVSLGSQPDPKLDEKARKAAEKRAENEARLHEAELAILAYNEAAIANGYQTCDTLPEKRLTRLLRRLEEIKGLENFTRALSAIPKNRFLAGKVPGTNGDPPFKLTIDRLLQTDGKMGDVLASLMESANQPVSYAGLTGPNGKLWGWWDHGGLADRMRTMSDERWRKALMAHPPNGQWPWWIFGPPAGSPDCLMPDHLVEEFGYAAKYKGSIEHV